MYSVVVLHVAVIALVTAVVVVLNALIIIAEATQASLHEHMKGIVLVM